MRQRYIDFVPAKGKKNAKNGVNSSVLKVAVKDVDKKPAPRKKTEKKPTPKKKEWVNPLVEEIDVEDIEEIFAEKPEPAGVSRNGAKFGVIEDYQPKFVKTEVKKRPLGESKPTKTLKSTAVSKPVVRAAAKPAVKPAVKTAAKPAVKTATNKSMQPMGARTKFVNVNKIEKRPLSKIDYPKKPVIIKEEKSSKPERIIAKPEKDSKAGLIIAIILTIILGAAAGTVAFLLLPK